MGEGAGGSGGVGGQGGAGGASNGSPCTSPDECASGFCADDVCCDAACDGGCEACNTAPDVGVCTPHAPATDPEDACNGGAGVCDGHGACADGRLDWDYEVGNDSGQALSHVAVDAAGSAAVAGVNSGSSFTFGSSNVAAGAFVARLTPTGTPSWAVRYNGCGTDTPGVQALATAPNGNTLLAGSCESGPTTRVRYVRAYGPSGEQLWTHVIGDMFYWGVRILTDANSNVYLVGYSAFVELDFAGTPLGPLDGAEWSFVVKLNQNGVYQWSEAFGSGSTFATDAALTAAGDLFIVLRFAGTLSVGTQTLVAPSPSAQSHHAVVKMGSDGAVHWARQLATVNDRPAKVAAAPALVHVLGRYAQDINLGGSVLGNVGSDDIFRLALDDRGNHVSSQGYGTSTQEVLGAVDTDALGNLVFALSSGAANFGGGTLDGPALVKLGANAVHLWSFEAQPGALVDIATTPDGKTITVGGDVVTAYRP